MVLLGLAHRYASVYHVASLHIHRLVEIEHRLLPVRLFFVGGSRQVDLLCTVAKVTVEPCDETVHASLHFNLKGEVTLEVQFLNGDCLEVDVVEFVSSGKDVLMVDGVDDGLRQHPFLHALHAHPINAVPVV